VKHSAILIKYVFWLFSCREMSITSFRDDVQWVRDIDVAGEVSESFCGVVYLRCVYFFLHPRYAKLLQPLITQPRLHQLRLKPPILLLQILKIRFLQFHIMTPHRPNNPLTPL